VVEILTIIALALVIFLVVLVIFVVLAVYKGFLARGEVEAIEIVPQKVRDYVTPLTRAKRQLKERCG